MSFVCVERAHDHGLHSGRPRRRKQAAFVSSSLRGEDDLFELGVLCDLRGSMSVHDPARFIDGDDPIRRKIGERLSLA